MQNTQLTDFDDIETPVQSSATTSDPPSPDSLSIDDVSLPDKGFEWKDEIKWICDDTLAVVEPADKIIICEKPIPESSVGYVVAGLENYLEKYADENIHPPSTYQEVSEMSNYYAEITTGGFGTRSSSQWGWGITPHRFKQGLKLATGGNQYRASDVKITACGEFGFITEYHGEAYALSTIKVGSTEKTITKTTVSGVTIENEENEQVIKGFQRVKPILEDVFNINITKFKKRDSVALYFDVEGYDKPLRLKGSHLKTATSPAENLGELAGEYQITTVHRGDKYTYEFNPDRLSNPAGELTAENQYLLGYKKKEMRQSRGRGPKRYGAGIEILAEPYYLEVSPKKYSSRIETRIYRGRCHDLVDVVQFDRPDHPNPEELSDVRMEIRPDFNSNSD